MMRKITSLLLTAILLATMLTVFAVPASAKKNPFGLDPDNVGKWATSNMYYNVTNANNYYFITGVLPSNDRYYATQYLDRAGTYSNLGTASHAASEFTIIPDSNVPQAIRNMAANDYPDLVPTGSVLSEGSLVIVVGVAAAVVFGLGGFILGKAAGKKKKLAIADGTDNTDEE